MGGDEVLERLVQREIDEFSSRIRCVQERARLRTQSPIEAVMYFVLYQESESIMSMYSDDRSYWMNFFPQFQIGKYRVDFLVTWRERQIIIECDGHDFHEKTKEQAARDKRRDREFTKNGYYVLRYTGSEILSDQLQVLLDLRRMAGLNAFAEIIDGAE